MSTLTERAAQMFPTQTSAQIGMSKRFAGGSLAFAAGEVLFQVRERGVPSWLAVDGEIDLMLSPACAGEGGYSGITGRATPPMRTGADQ